MGSLTNRKPAIVAVAAVAVSCKKDRRDETPFSEAITNLLQIRRRQDLQRAAQGVKQMLDFGPSWRFKSRTACLNGANPGT
jgi:hypothetical protein